MRPLDTGSGWNGKTLMDRSWEGVRKREYKEKKNAECDREHIKRPYYLLWI